MYRLKLHGGNSLLLHHTLYAPGVRCSLVSYVSLMKLGFHFVSRTNGLDILYGGNLFGHASLIDNSLFWTWTNIIIVIKHLLFLFHLLIQILTLWYGMLDWVILAKIE